MRALTRALKAASFSRISVWQTQICRTLCSSYRIATKSSIAEAATKGITIWEKNFFRRDVIAVMVKVRGDERGNACSFTRTLPQGDRNDWLLKERLD